MREIKFKAKTIGNEWVFGNVSHLKKDFSTVRKGYYISNSAGAPFAFMVRPETVGQFTGLKDKNGKEIYEGDVLCAGKQSKRPHWKKGHDYYSVSFSNGEFIGNGYNGEMPVSPSLNILNFKCEIIGNIYENPELLK